MHSTRFSAKDTGRATWIPQTLLITLISIETLTQVGINPWILVAVVLGAVLTMPQAAQAPFIAFLFPLAAFLEFNVIIAGVLAIVVLRFSRNISVPLQVIFPILGILILELISAVTGDWQLGDFTKFTAYLLLTALLTVQLNFYEEAKATIHNYLLGFSVFSIIFIVTAALSGNIEALINPTDRLTDAALQSANVTAINPNTIGIMALMALTLIQVNVYDDRSLPQLLTVPLALWIGLLTGSRTFTLGVVTLGALLLVAGIRSLASDGDKTLLGIVAGTALFTYYFIQKFPHLVEMAVGRITKVDDITNGRIQINSAYWEALVSNAQWTLIGGGLQKHSDLMGVDMSVHNAPLEVLVSWGIIGSILIVVLLSVLVLQQVEGTNATTGERTMHSAIRIVNLVPLLVIFVAMLGSQGFSIWRTILYVMVLRAVMVIGVHAARRRTPDRKSSTRDPQPEGSSPFPEPLSANQESTTDA